MSDRPATVLAYHAIGTCSDDRHNLFVSEKAFAQQMAYLARRHAVVSLDDLLAGRAGRRAVAITFDDAYVSVFESALPLLERHGFPATVFAPTGFLGSRNRWDGPSRCPLDIAPAEMLVAAEGRGVSVQSHGHGHIDMASAAADEARDDLIESIRILTELTGNKPAFVAYPYGTSSLEVREIARALGFTAAFSIDRPHEGPFAYERSQVTPRDGLGMFGLKASGRYIPLRFSRFGRTAVELRQRLLRAASSKS